MHTKAKAAAVNDTEKKVMSIYRESQPARDFVGEASTTNHWAWSLLVLALGLILWLAIAVVSAENQRNALISKACQDRVFPAELDTHCLAFVHSRAHWWQHLAYALTHLQP